MAELRSNEEPVEIMRIAVEDLRGMLSTAGLRSCLDDLQRSAPGVLAEVTRLRTVVAEYENCITWDTTCKNCAHLLDECYAEHCRADAARVEVSQLRAKIEAVRAELAKHVPCDDGTECEECGHPWRTWDRAPGCIVVQSFDSLAEPLGSSPDEEVK